MSGAPATTQPDFTVSYIDNNGTTQTEGSNDGVFTGTTQVTLAPAPASATRRTVGDINIHNADTATNTFTVKYNNNGTLRLIAKFTLLTGERWSLAHGSFDSNGNLKSAAGGVLGIASGGTNANTAAGAATNFGLGTGDSPQFTGINLGHATDTTLGRTSAGVADVEGDPIVTRAQNNTFTKSQRGSITVLTDAVTIAINLADNNFFKVLLGGNRTLGVPTGIVEGQTGGITPYQDGTGSRTLAYAWIYQNPSGTVPVLSTGKYTKDYLAYSVDLYKQSTITVTIATPGVVTWASHGLYGGQEIQLTTTGALPTGLSVDTSYFIIPVDANSFQLATSLANAQAGTAIATSGSQSGTTNCRQRYR